MTDDDLPELPAFLKIPQAERDKSWAGRTLTTTRAIMTIPAKPGADAMAKTAKKTAKKASPKKAPKSTARKVVTKAARSSARAVKAEGGVRPGSKLEIIVGLLKRPEGCTTAQVLEATAWPTVSMPQQAKAAGLTLSKEKVDGVTVYRAS